MDTNMWLLVPLLELSPQEGGAGHQAEMVEQIQTNLSEKNSNFKNQYLI